MSNNRRTMVWRKVGSREKVALALLASIAVVFATSVVSCNAILGMEELGPMITTNGNDAGAAGGHGERQRNRRCRAWWPRDTPTQGSLWRTLLNQANCTPPTETPDPG